MRTLLRSGVVGAVVLSSLLFTSSAYALERDDGDDPGEPLSTLKVLLYFVLCPVAAMVTIWVLVSLPSIMKGPRYRPGQDWKGGDEWYGAPGGSEAKPGRGRHAASGGRAEDGRAEDGAALTGTIIDGRESIDSGSGDPGAAADGGGTSARW